MRLKSNAKINLTLDIKSKRPDGYHDLHSVMQSVSIADEIEILKSDGICVWYSDLGDVGCEDICHKAALRFFESVGIAGGAQIKIIKNIPCVAGVGGSSSDAAAVILALNSLYNTALSASSLIDIAVKVGADVPFCIVGGSCEVSGIGEKITPISPCPKCAFLIVVLGKKASTGYMYEMIDRVNNPSSSTERLLEIWENADIKDICSCLHNSFADVYSIASERELLSKLNPIGISLSGSGPAVFAVFPDEKSAISAQSVLLAQNIKSYLALPTEKSVIFE